VVLLAITALLVCLAAPQVWAWSKLRAGRAALSRHHPAEAGAALRSCARVWGERPSVRLLAARAAWQAGNLEEARSELRAAQRLEGSATEATAFEWALIEASAGNVREVDEYLQRRAEESPAAAPASWEALAMGYLRLYRTLDAMAILNHWLTRAPNNVRALELRAETYVAGNGVVRGAEDYRRALELDPSRDETRRRLIDCLLRLGGYEEAAAHLERLATADRDDPATAAQLARCYAMIGRGDEARRLAEATLAKHPDDPLCLRSMGQIELISRRPAEAERHLRRAAALAPEDYQAQQLFFQSLQQQGKTEEAKAQLAVAEALRDRLARLGEITSRRMAQSPLDPALQYEFGKLLIETGQPDVGVQWLLSAVSLDPEHRPSHAALAAYYEARGEREKAEYHRVRSVPKE
jgi:predicted Zn-dependent protease